MNIIIYYGNMITRRLDVPSLYDNIWDGYTHYRHGGPRWEYEQMTEVVLDRGMLILVDTNDPVSLERLNCTVVI